MSAYIYNVFEKNDDCTECMGDRQLLLSTTKKWVATKFLRGILDKGLSIYNHEVSRSRDGMGGTATNVDVYEFVEIDPGEVV